jgi:hypothetical protein
MRTSAGSSVALGPKRMFRSAVKRNDIAPITIVQGRKAGSPLDLWVKRGRR